MLEWIDDITAFIFLHDAPQKADILFIPGNGHAEPSEYAAQLYHSGYAPLILPSGRFSVTTGGFDGQKSGAKRYEGRFETEMEWSFHSENDSPLHPLLLSRCRAGCRGKPLISGLFSLITTKTTEK